MDIFEAAEYSVWAFWPTYYEELSLYARGNSSAYNTSREPTAPHMLTRRSKLLLSTVLRSDSHKLV